MADKNEPHQKFPEVVDFQYWEDGKFKSSNKIERIIFPAKGRKGRYVRNMTNTKEYLTSDNPPVIIRHGRTIKNTNPL